MKRITRCYECKKLVRLHGSMVAKVAENVKKFRDDGVVIEVVEEKKVTLCRNCVAEAGYKVESKKGN